MRFTHIFQRIGLVDFDLHCTTCDDIEQLVRRLLEFSTLCNVIKQRRAGGKSEPF